MSLDSSPYLCILFYYIELVIFLYSDYNEDNANFSVPFANWTRCTTLYLTYLSS